MDIVGRKLMVVILSFLQFQFIILGFETTDTLNIIMTRLSNSFFANWLFYVLLLRVDTLQSYLVRVHDLCRGWGRGARIFPVSFFLGGGGLWKISANVTEGFKGG